MVQVNLTSKASLFPSTDYAGNVIRFGLIDVKPIETVRIVKKFGIKFKEIVRTLTYPTTSIQSFDELVTFQNKLIFDTISVPKRFDSKELVRIFSEYAIKRYEKDRELKGIIQEIKEARNICKPLLSFILLIKTRYESKRDDLLETEAKVFLNSNFPLSFYSKFVEFDSLFYSFLKILERIVRMYELYAFTVRGDFRKYQRTIDEMKKKISPMLDVMDDCFISMLRLKRYVVIWNSENYKEIFSPKFLDIEKVDFHEFKELSRDFNDNLKKAKEYLLHYDPEFLCKEINFNEQTAKIFSKLITLPVKAE